MVPTGSHVVVVKASSLRDGRGKHNLTYHLLGESDDLLNLLESHEELPNDTVQTENRSATPLLPIYPDTHPFSADRSYHLAVDGKTFAAIREHFPDTIYRRVGHQHCH